MRADRKPLCIGVSLFACVALATGAAGAEPPVREGPQPVRAGDHGIGRCVGDLAFTDLAGAAQSLGKLADGQIVVFACTITAARSASVSFIPATRTTARSSNSM
jgi:hypothetical protein